MTGEVVAGEGRASDSSEHPWQPTPVPVDWLWNTLEVGGPAERVEAFRLAAAGAGVVPWVLDLAALEEEFLLLMAGPQDGVRAISLSGAKVLARRLRDAAAASWRQPSPCWREERDKPPSPRPPTDPPHSISGVSRMRCGALLNCSGNTRANSPWSAACRPSQLTPLTGRSAFGRP